MSPTEAFNTRQALQYLVGQKIKTRGMIAEVMMVLGGCEELFFISKVDNELIYTNATAQGEFELLE